MTAPPATPIGFAPTTPVRRTAEIEEWSNRRLIHPLSAALVPRLARSGVSPNAVSLFGMGCGLSAGICYAGWRHPLFCVLGFALMLCWHVADGADGQLARLTNRQSTSGKVLDGICDYVTFVAVYTALGLSLIRTDGIAVVALVAFAGVCHAAQSAAYEARREQYDALVHGRGSAVPPFPRHAATPPSGRRALRDRLHAAYERLQRAFGTGSALRNAWDDLSRHHPEQLPALRTRYRARFAPLVRRWSILCANYRTLGLFLFAILARPAWYFVFEIVGLTAALMLLLAAQHRAERSFAADLRTAPAPPASADPTRPAVALDLHSA